MIKINCATLGKLSWEPPEELVKLIPNRMEPVMIELFFRSFLYSVLVSQTVTGELATKSDKTVRLSLHSLSLAINELAEIAEGKRPYPITNEADLVR